MKKARVIMYNQVGDYPAASMEDGMEPHAFARDMAYLVDHKFKVISLSESMHLAEGDAPLDDHMLALTFDGGYHDVITCVAPIMSKHGFPAAFMVPIHYLGESTSVGGAQIECMDIDQLKTLINLGFDIGAYLLGGRAYNQSMEQELIQELKEAVYFFTNQLQIPLLFVSVREGVLGDVGRKALQDLGIKAFLTKCPTKRRQHPYCVGRIQIDDDDPNIFQVKISKNYLRFKDSSIWPYMRKYKLDRLAHCISDLVNAQRKGG